MIKLGDIEDAFNATDEFGEGFYKRSTEEIVWVLEDGFGNDEYNDSVSDEIDSNPDDYVRLPNEYDIDDYGIMKEYIYQLPAGEQAEQLESAIHHSKPFRHFRELVERFGLLDQWYKFQAQSYHDEAVAWCEENNIKFDDK